MNKKFFLFFFFIFIIASIFLLQRGMTGRVIGIQEHKPEKVIANLYKAIEIAEQKGDYKCCIEPACTMCYLGHWKFEEGKCFCDDAIAEGRNEDVCPECVKGLEEGLCESKKEGCELDAEVYG